MPASSGRPDDRTGTPAQPRRPTLRDVAERAGVSTTTASFVLSGRRDMRISAATEERVSQAARTLEYRRRLVPRATLPAGAPAIGLISDVVATESFAGEMLRGCIAAAADRGRGAQRPGRDGRLSGHGGGGAAGAGGPVGGVVRQLRPRRWLDPGLTSADLPYFDIGRYAAELLLADAPPPRIHELPMRLAHRGSVAAPREL